ncbi:caspase recruitment domain family, member 19 isoform X2 [Mobula hypostoma]|uniref:caspase recruitment domain family, member 19 isoform X2 n=1 Tax=Mobula hypostoma TaxID=723540 RepID=UPI002FC3A1D1
MGGNQSTQRKPTRSQGERTNSSRTATGVDSVLLFRSLNTPACIRISKLLVHLQSKNNKACKEFYNALEINDPQIYEKLPSKYLGKMTDSMGLNIDIYHREKYILNNRGPAFFLACFSVAAGLAFLLYHCKEDSKFESTAKKIVGFSYLGFGKRARRYLLAYLEDQSKRN